MGNTSLQLLLGSGDMGSMYILSYQVRWYVHIFQSVWYMHVTWSVQCVWYVHVPRSLQRYVHVPNGYISFCT